MALTKRRRLVLSAYTSDPAATLEDALKKSGYSEKRAKITACELRRDPEFIAAIERKQTQALAKLEREALTDEEVINGIRDIDAECQLAGPVAGFLALRLKAHELLAKIRGMFIEKIEVGWGRRWPRKSQPHARGLNRPRCPPWSLKAALPRTRTQTEMLTPADRELAADMARFYADPLGFVRYAFPWKQPGLLANHDGPDTWQIDFLTELGAEVKARNFDGHTPVNPIRMTRASGHGIGKSTISAWLTLWIMSTRPRSKGTMTANTGAQLQTKTWAQLQYWLKLCITRHWFEISTERLNARDQRESWFVAAASPEEKHTESYAGQHASDATSFYIFDEASGISDKIFDVAEGGLTDGEPMVFLFGNPTQNSGKFYRVNFGSERNGWNHGSIDSRTSRFTNKALIAEWAERYGEDSDWFRFRVKGEAPRVGFSAFIPPDAVDACRRYKAEGFTSLPKILACDVARYGDDRSIVGMRQGRQYRILGKYRGLDTVEVAERVIGFIDSEDPDATVVDGDGLGAGVVDQIKHRNYGRTLHDFHGGSNADDCAMYFNKRTEIWGWMRDWLKAGAEIPDDPELAVDLCAPGFDTARGKRFHGTIQLEAKDDLKARGLASPDDGDTLAMTFAVKVAAKARPKYGPDLVYSFPERSLSWMR